jgi:hypothetical protein
MTSAQNHQQLLSGNKLRITMAILNFDIAIVFKFKIVNYD